MLPDTQSRVADHTNPRLNARIKHDALVNIVHALRSDSIDARLEELEREWDTERTLQTNFAVVALAGLALSTKDRRWLLLSAGAAGFMMQHALQGWCPPLALFRRLGVRDAGEIERERIALQALRAARETEHFEMSQ